MRSSHIIAAYLIVAISITFSACSNPPPDPIVVENAWIREAPPGANAMAGYMQISNTTNNHIILKSANSPNFNSIEFHRSIEKNGVYKMVPQLHLHIDANTTFELKPGDFHFMLFKPKSALKQGDHVEMSLLFSNNLLVTTKVPVKKAEY